MNGLENRLNKILLHITVAGIYSCVKLVET